MVVTQSNKGDISGCDTVWQRWHKWLWHSLTKVTKVVVYRRLRFLLSWCRLRRILAPPKVDAWSKPAFYTCLMLLARDQLKQGNEVGNDTNASDLPKVFLLQKRKCPVSGPGPVEFLGVWRNFLWRSAKQICALAPRWVFPARLWLTQFTKHGWLTKKSKLAPLSLVANTTTKIYTNTSIAADLSSIASNHLTASLDWKKTTLLFVKTLYLSQLLLSCFNFLHVFMEYHHSRWDSYHASLVVQKSSIHLFQHLFTEVLSFKNPSFKKIPN